MLRPSRLAHNLAVLVSGEVAGRLLSLVAVASLARRLDADGFGLISFAGALVGYFGLAVNCGLELIGSREIARQPERLPATVATVQVLRLALAGAACAGLLALAAALPIRPEARLLVGLYGLVLPVLAVNLGWAFQGAERMTGFAGATLAGQAVFAGGVLLTVRSRDDLLRVPLVQVAAELTAAAILLALFAGRYGRPRGGLDGARAWSSLRAAGPLFLGRAIRGAALSADVLALRFFLGDASVGLYAASSRILYFLLALTALYFTNLYPTLSRVAAREPAVRRALIARSLRFTALVAAPVAVAGVVLAEPLVTAVFSARYAAAVPPFRLHIIALAFMMLAGNYRTVLVALGHQAADTRVVAAGALVTVGLTLALVPRLGPPGAALAFLAGEAGILALGRRAVARRGLAEPLAAHLARPLAASLPMALALLATGAAPLVVRVAAGAAVYAVSALAVRAISIAELRAALFRSAPAPAPPEKVDRWPGPY